MSEHTERLPVGPKGAKGDPGMPRGQRRAIVFLFFFSVALSIASYLAGARHYDDSQAAQQRQQRQEQAAQQRQGELLEAKLCTTLGKLAALQPPGGNPKTNPSRAYEQGQHAVLAQLGPDIGCK